MAKRFIFARHSFSFIRIITMISVAGIAIGTAAIVIVVSIFNGFQELVSLQLTSFDPHLRVINAAGGTLAGASQLTRVVASTPGVVAVAPTVSTKAVILSRGRLHAIQLIGINPEEYSRVSSLGRSVVSGGYFSHPGLLLGVALADKARLLSGDTMSILFPTDIESAIATSRAPIPSTVSVSGLFQSNERTYDTYYAFAPIGTVRRALRLSADAASSLDIRTGSVDSARVVAQRLRAVLPASASILTWYDLHRELYSVMEFERMAAFIILSIIVLVAVFNIFASLTMTVTEKKSELGVLRAMGFRSGDVVRLFIFEGFTIGLIGTGAGIALGVGLCLAHLQWGLIRLDSGRYIVDTLPLALHLADVVSVALSALALATVAGIIPAKRAGRQRSTIGLIRA